MDRTEPKLGPDGVPEVALTRRGVERWQGGHPYRLVLHFNARGAPNAAADCRLLAEAPTNPPSPGRFTVNATFCEGPAWQAHGFLRALEIEDGDMDAFANMMRQLMLAIFHEQKDR